MDNKQQPTPQYDKGDSVYDDCGNLLGTVQHRSYNEYTGFWSYTLADSMSYHNGRFIFYTPHSEVRR